MSELLEVRESVEPSVRAATLGVDASWVGAGFFATPLFRARSGGLVLGGGCGDPIESDAISAIFSGARWRCPFGLADASVIGPTIFS
jgi:hypothetical protein